MDGLTILLNQYAVSAGVFYAGGLCGAHAFPEDAQRGHLHLLRGGCVLVVGFTASHIVLSEPTLLFLPRPGPHRLIVPPEIRAEMVCGTVEFGKSGWNPLTACLPDLLTLPLNAMPGLSALVDAMFDEAFQQRLGVRRCWIATAKSSWCVCSIIVSNAVWRRVGRWLVWHTPGWRPCCRRCMPTRSRHGS